MLKYSKPLTTTINSLRSLNTPRYFSQSFRLNQVQEIESVDQFKTLISNDKVTLVDFYATWCGPCKAIEPFINQLSDKIPQVSFARVDVDQQQEIARSNNISAMPTLLYFKDGKNIDGVIGADLRKIVDKLSDHADVDIKL